MGELRAGQEGSEGEGDVGDDVQDDPGFGGVLHFKVPSELMLLLPPTMLRIRPMVMRSWIRRKWMALRGKVLVSLTESTL